MNWLSKFTMVIAAMALLSASCENEQKRQPRTYSQEELLEANRKRVGNESDMIDAFIEKNGWTMEKTATGLRYEIYHDSAGTAASEEMIATISYTAYLLDSTQVAGTNVSGPQQFRIGRDDVVSGLHEAALLLSAGDSVRLILPNYLAYGLTGDVNIPSNAALLYDLTLVSVR